MLPRLRERPEANLAPFLLECLKLGVGFNMKSLISLLCLIQSFIGVMIFSDGGMWYDSDRQRAGIAIVILALITIYLLRSRQDSLLSLWFQRKQLEQKAKIEELKAATPSNGE